MYDPKIPTPNFLLIRWVPVAPVGTGDSPELFSQLRLPTMLVYGEKDTGLGHR